MNLAANPATCAMPAPAGATTLAPVAPAAGGQPSDGFDAILTALMDELGSLAGVNPAPAGAAGTSASALTLPLSTAAVPNTDTGNPAERPPAASSPLQSGDTPAPKGTRAADKATEPASIPAAVLARLAAIANAKDGMPVQAMPARVAMASAARGSLSVDESGNNSANNSATNAKKEKVQGSHDAVSALAGSNAALAAANPVPPTQQMPQPHSDDRGDNTLAKPGAAVAPAQPAATRVPPAPTDAAASDAQDLPAAGQAAQVATQAANATVVDADADAALDFLATLSAIAPGARSDAPQVAPAPASSNAAKKPPSSPTPPQATARGSDFAAQLAQGTNSAGHAGTQVSSSRDERDDPVSSNGTTAANASGPSTATQPTAHPEALPAAPGGATHEVQVAPFGSDVQAAAASSSAQPQATGPAGASPVVSASLHVSAQIQAVQPNIDALAINIAAKSLDGIKQFNIRLDPPELGRVEVRLSVDDAGKAQASLSVDRPQTLQLLQGDSANLARALKDAGLDLSGNGLNFSLRGQDRQNAGGRDPQRGRALSVRALAGINAASQVSNIATRTLASSSVGVDIRV